MDLGSKWTWLGSIAGIAAMPAMFVAAHLLTPSGPLVVRPAAHLERAQLQAAVDRADRATDASYVEFEAACREFLRELRSEWRLRAFVGELLSFQQKLQLGGDMWNNGNSRARIVQLFGSHVAEEQFVSDALADAARTYQDLLKAQDEALLTSLGVEARLAQGAIAQLELPIPAWRGMYEGAIEDSLFEARKDVARGTATLAAGNVFGEGLHNVARATGLNTTQEGSWTDLVIRGAIDFGTSAVLDSVTDPTDDVVADLRRRLESAEADLLEGPEGLLPFLRKLKEAHQAARREWILRTAY